MTHEERTKAIQDAQRELNESAEWFINQINDGTYSGQNGPDGRKLLFGLLETAQTIGKMKHQHKILSEL